jgi:predicted ATPase
MGYAPALTQLEGLVDFIQLRNVRSLTDTGRVAIAPITLLLGQNSSGKSTFVRFLPLLKQGAEARTREPFLWLGRLVDFGGTSEAFSKFAANNRMGLTFQLRVPASALDGARRRTYPQQAAQPEAVSIAIDYVLSEKTSVIGYEYVVRFGTHSIEISMTDAGRITSFLINGSDMSELVSSSALSVTWLGPLPTFESLEPDAQSGRGAYAELFKFVRAHLEGRTGTDRASRLVQGLAVGSINDLRERALSLSAGDEYWRRQVRGWADGSQNMRRLTELVLLYQFFSDISSALSLHVRRNLINIRYITPLRASAERYYRLQGLSIEEIDPQGQNVAMYLHNLNQVEKIGFSTWMEEFFGVEVTTHPSQGHVSLYLRSKDAVAGFNLADTGFGYSQILPILVQLWSIASKRRLGSGVPTVFAIEQPELHLHPKLQGKLADVFINAVKAARRIGVDLRLVIETHSEQIVSALGLEIARGELPASDVNVVLFEKAKLSEPTKVYAAAFQQDGILKNWPYGFFDAQD